MFKEHPFWAPIDKAGGAEEGSPRQVQEVVRYEEFPREPEARFEAILPAIANSAAKQVTMLLLEEYPQTGWELRGRFSDVAIAPWEPRENIFAGYCRSSLIPIGTVAEEAFFFSGGAEMSVGFSATEAGVQYGQPVAAYLLDKTRQQIREGSPYFWQTLGQTSSKYENRAPVVRSKIITFLSRHPQRSFSQMELIEVLELPQTTLRNHLEVLDELGMVDYSTVRPDDSGWATYKLVRESFDEEELFELAQGSYYLPLIHRSSILQGVMRLLSEQGSLDAQSLSKTLDCEPQYVSRTLSLMRDQGIVEPDLFYVARPGGKRSEMRITEGGLELARELDILKEALSDGPWLESMRKKAQQFRNRPSLFQEVGSLAINEWLPFSFSRKMRSRAERKLQLLELVKAQGEIRPKDLYGTGISDEYLRELLAEGRLAVERRGAGAYYRLPEED